MPTLLQPQLKHSNKRSSNLNHHNSEFVDTTDVENEKKKPNPPNKRHIYISPALYTTPEQTPVSGSSVDSLSPSPYVFNRKGRGGKAFGRRLEAFETDKDIICDHNHCNSNGGEFENEGEFQVDEGVYDEFLGAEIVRERDEDAVVDEEFMDTRCDISSVTSSSSRFNGFWREVENISCASNQGDFFDADEELYSDGSITNGPSSFQSIDLMLRATRLSLLEEIEKRKTSEEALEIMANQWQRVTSVLSRLGLTFPSPSNTNTNMQIDIDSVEQSVQEIIVGRFVADAIGRGEARAEAEIKAQEIIQSKDNEISRLRDRLQYYEAVYREMSQRNQEAMEVARQERQRKKNRHQRWLWGCIGFSITLGASVIAYSFLGQYDSALKSSTHSSDAPSVISSESAAGEMRV